MAFGKLDNTKLTWTEQYKKICDSLEITNRADLCGYLNEVFSLGPTGGEIFDIALSRILKLNNEGLLNGIQDEVKAIIDYAKSIGHL
jgi:hypothetical protein